MADGVDDAQLQVAYARRIACVEVDAVLIAAYPHTPQLIDIEVTQGVVAQGGLVVLVVEELLHVVAGEVDNEEPTVVCGQPDTLLVVGHHVPDGSLVGHVVDTPLSQDLQCRVVPLSRLLVAQISASVSDNPEVAVAIKSRYTILVVRQSVGRQVVVLADDDVAVAVEGDDLALVRCQHHHIAKLSHARHAYLLIDFLLVVAEAELLQTLILSVVVEESVDVGLHPEVFPAVHEEILDATSDAQLLEYAFGVSVTTLGDGVEDGIAHALFQPQASVTVLKDLLYVVRAQRGGVAQVIVVRLYAVAVIAVQTVGSTYPDKALGVAIDGEHLRVRQSVTGVEPTELHIGDGRAKG